MKTAIRISSILVFVLLVASLLLKPAAGQPAPVSRDLPAAVIDRPEEGPSRARWWPPQNGPARRMYGLKQK